MLLKKTGKLSSHIFWLSNLEWRNWFVSCVVLFSAAVTIQLTPNIFKAFFKSDFIPVSWLHYFLCFSFSYLDCIPKCFAQNIAKSNFLTKIRIERVFADFVRPFQEHASVTGQIDTHKIMLKYISTLERLAPSFGVEIFHVSHLKIRDAWEESGVSHGHARGDDRAAAPREIIMVNGNKGILWRPSVQTVS